MTAAFLIRCCSTFFLTLKQKPVPLSFLQTDILFLPALSPTGIAGGASVDPDR